MPLRILFLQLGLLALGACGGGSAQDEPAPPVHALRLHAGTTPETATVANADALDVPGAEDAPLQLAALEPAALAAATGAALNCPLVLNKAFGEGCGFSVSTTVPNGGALRLRNTRAGFVGEQTAVCSHAKLVWLPPQCAAQGKAPAPTPAPVTANKLSLSWSELQQFNRDWQLEHEALPKGVPDSFDWQARPKKDRWNSPSADFKALTGWGQAFWVQGETATPSYLQLREHQTLVCHGAQRQWSLVQRNRVEGAEFRPDYQGNLAVPTPFFASTGDTNLVGWGPLGAYHYWPFGGRAALPEGPLCGLLVLVQARAVPAREEAGAAPPAILMGMGADYWLSKSAPWDNYRTNQGLGVGRLKLVRADWAWFGISSASDADLRNLFDKGFVDLRAR